MHQAVTLMRQTYFDSMCFWVVAWLLSCLYVRQVYANDLNPRSYHWLERNIALNRVCRMCPIHTTAAG